jgi:hypothetical protein
MFGMRFLPRLGSSASWPDKNEELGSASDAQAAGSVDAVDEELEETHLLKTVGWISAALGAVALGLLVGRELRQRYKFNRRTPYDLYSHSGDELPDVDCGVGI